MGEEMTIRKDQPQPWSQPEILKFSVAADKKRIEEILSPTNHIVCLDEIDRAAEELFHIAYPKQIDTVNKTEFRFVGSMTSLSIMIYLPPMP